MRKLAIVLSAVVLAACVAVAPRPFPGPGPAASRGHGPPPHAPAHGYRAKTAQGAQIVFDTKIGVYVVVDVPGSYWLDDRYYRKGTSGWVVGASLDGPWKVCAPGDLPKGLQNGASKQNGNSKKGNGKNGK